MPKRMLPPKTWLTPAPAVLVSTADATGRPNVATVAWCGVLCSSPPMLGVSLRPATHSHGLIAGRGEYVVNVPDASLARVVDYCGCVSGRDVDKFAAAKLTALPATHVAAPLVAECPINIECRVTRVIELGGHHLFVGEILAVHADEEALDADGLPTRLAPLAYRPEVRRYAEVGAPLGRFGFSEKDPGAR